MSLKEDIITNKKAREHGSAVWIFVKNERKKINEKEFSGGCEISVKRKHSG